MEREDFYKSFFMSITITVIASLAELALNTVLSADCKKVRKKTKKKQKKK